MINNIIRLAKKVSLEMEASNYDTSDYGQQQVEWLNNSQ